MPVLSKINLIRRNLIAWVKAQAASSKDSLLLNQDLLEQALSEQCLNQDRILELKQILEKAYAEEEAFCRQRSRIQWLNEGDKNASFFHAVSRGRRARSRFPVIENEEGQAFYEEDQIVSAFVTFYQNLFTAGNTEALSVVQEALAPKISGETNMSLIAIPDKSEVRDTVFSVHPIKLLGQMDSRKDSIKVFGISSEMTFIGISGVSLKLASSNRDRMKHMST